MNAMALDLATGLELRQPVRVSRLERNAGGWRLLDEQRTDLGRFSVVLVTVPAPQAVPLIESQPQLAELPGQTRLRPCWALLLGLHRPLRFELDAAFINTGPISWIARNSSKPGRAGGEAWVVHATPEWSESHLEAEDGEIRESLHRAFEQVLEDRAGVLHAEVHRWRFAIPDPALPQRSYFDPELGLGLAGDWCGGPRIEGAYASGRDLAQRLLAALDT
jgi:predicted NAD/FAD-dependent oxidoreductase